MAIQTVELEGHRFVIVPEQEYLALQQLAQSANRKIDTAAYSKPKFPIVEPLDLPSIPASEMLIWDRR